MPNFVVERDRDAWATIHGFIYQIALTLQRWLSLGPGQFLELERGEDIDRIGSALDAADASPQKLVRILEQVKRREQAVTLRSEPAIAAVANAVEHRVLNPTLDLLFRYTTNAPIGQERRSPFSPKLPALRVWESLRTEQLPETEARRLLAGLLTLLHEARKPHDMRETTWRRFTAFVGSATPEQLVDLIRHFEWGTGAPELHALRPAIEENLIQRGFASTPEQARAMYDRLFAHVIRLLTQRGVKQLTREHLLEQVSRPSLAEQDRALLAVLTDTVQRVEVRLSSLERAVERHGEAVDSVRTVVQELARKQDALIAPRFDTSPPELQVPPLVARLSRRSETVRELRSALTVRTWIALHGSVGSGKTQLAALVAEQGSCRAWIRLRDQPPDGAVRIIDAAIQELIGAATGGDRAAWYRAMGARMGAGTLLVLDDLPRLHGGEALSARLIELALACRDTGVHLLTTSPHPLPHRLRSSLDDRTFLERESPPMTETETAEVLAASGATTRVMEAPTVRLLNGLVRGHPMLITALARHLAQDGWQTTGETLARLLSLDFAADVSADTRRMLRTTVPDDHGRELLYRLTLVLDTFTFDDAAALAAVAPPVSHPGERLDDLDGLWVQRDARQRLLISPLVQVLGAGDLAEETTRRCHRVLGERLVKRRILAPGEIHLAILHYHRAEDFNVAAIIFIQALQALRDLDPSVPDWGMLDLWDDMPLPNEMDLALRLYIRALQIAVRRERDLPTSHLLADLDRLLERAGEAEAWAMLAVAAFAGVDGTHAVRYLRLALRLYPKSRLADGRPFALPAELHPAELLWVAVPELAAADELRGWLDIVAQLPPEERERVFADDAAPLGALLFADRLWLAEVERPEGERRWDSVMAELQLIEERARQIGVELLRVAAIRAQLVVLGDYKADLVDARKVADEALTRVTPDPRFRFLIEDGLGQRYALAGRPEEALVWLRAALDEPTDAYPAQRVSALLHASAAAGARDPRAGVAYARRAAELAQASPDVHDLDAVKALGELAIACWRIDTEERLAACDALDAAGELLFTRRTDDMLWRDLSVGFGHVAQTLAALTLDVTNNRTAQATHQAADRQAPRVAAPTSGILLRLNGDGATRYAAEGDAVVCACLVRLLATVGRDARAAVWSGRGYGIARATGHTLALAQLDMYIIPELLCADRYRDALDRAISVGRAVVALRTASPHPDDPAPRSLDVDAALGPKPNDRWRKAEAAALDLVLLPAAFRLAGVTLDNPERARAAARTVAARCREAGAGSVQSELWTTTAEALERAFARDLAATELLERNAIFFPERQALGIVGWIGATIRPQIRLDLAFSLHLAAARYMYRSRATWPGAYRRLVLPFLREYWRGKAREQGFHFRTPRLLQERLAELGAGHEEEQGQAVLQEIAGALGMAVSADEWRW